MKKTFIKTKNVKRFVALMDELQKLPPNIPKLALVYGDHGLGKSQTIQWWADKNDSVYVRATQGMTSRWLLSEIAEELGEEPYWHTQETFELIENYLRQNPKIIIVDEIDYLIEKHTVETLRDLHDRTACPIVLVGMGAADKKLARYPHLVDRLYKTLKFEQFNAEDITEILQQITDLEFTPDAINYLTTRTNQFRQLVKLINKIEKLSETNKIDEIFPFAAACIKPPLLESQKQRLFLLGITEKYRKQDMSSFVISSQCNNCMAYQAKYKRKTATAK